MSFIFNGLKKMLGVGKDQSGGDDLKSLEEILKYDVDAEVFLVKGQTKDRLLKKAKVRFMRKENEAYKYFLQCEDVNGKEKPFFFPILENSVIECFTSKKGNKELNFTYINYQYALPQNDEYLRLRMDYTSEMDEVHSIVFGNYLSKLVYETTFKKSYLTADNDEDFGKFLKEVTKSDASMISNQSSNSIAQDDDLDKLGNQIQKQLNISEDKSGKKYPLLNQIQKPVEKASLDSKDQERVSQILLNLSKSPKNLFMTDGSFFQLNEDNQAKLLEQICIFCVSNEGNYNFKLKIYNMKEENTYEINLTENLSEYVDLTDNWIKWLDFQSTPGTALFLWYKFNQTHAGMTAKFIIARSKYENKIQVSLEEKLNSKKDAEREEAEYQEKMIKQDFENLDEKLFDEYDNIEELNFDFNEQPQSINSQVKEGLDGNRVMAQARLLNRTFITKGPVLGVYANDDENPADQSLSFLLNLPVIKTLDQQEVNPLKMMMTNQDTRVIILNENNNKKMLEMDIERAKIIREFTADPQSANGITDFSEFEKNNYQGSDVFNAINQRNIFRMDPRMSKNQVDCIAKESKIYNTKNNFTCITSNQNGQFCVGMENGEVNFYTNIGNAKNRIQTFGDAILGLDSTRDGKYLLATCQKYLILLPTSDNQGNQVTMFQKQVKIVERRQPFKLKLKPDDVFKYKLQDYSFQPAKFDYCEKEKERFIITSIGNVSVMWNFSKILRGDHNEYDIKVLKNEIKTIDFKFNQPDQVYTALDNEVCLVKTAKKTNSKK